MRNRWSLFIAGLIVFVFWYVVAYSVTSGTFTGVLWALALGLITAVAGLIVGAGIGVAVHAAGLAAIHREVRKGDARDGARVSLGKLPSIVPVVRKSESAGMPEQPPADPQSAPVPALDSTPGRDDSETPTAAADASDAGLSKPAAAAPDASMLGPNGHAFPDRLAIECARFASAHDGVAVTPDASGSGAIGTIDRAANPIAFAAFMTLVDALAGDGADVSRVAVSAGPDGLPATVTFPVFNANDGELK